MESTRVLLVGLPALLRDLVEQIVSESPDIEVVGDVDEARGLEEALEKTGAELVIATSANVEPTGKLRDALEARASLRVLALEKNAARGSLWSLRLERIDLAELSTETLVAVLRRS